MHSTEDEQQEGDQAAENISPRYDRNIRTFGAEGQRRLREAEVTVVGVSGLGGIIAEQSARVGVEKINLIDPDHIEKTNLPRVYGAYDSDVGETKVNTVGEHIKQINPDIEVTMHETVVESDDMDTVLKRSDAVIAGLDRMQSRSYLNQFCVRHGIPYFDAGVVIHTEDDSGAVESMDGFLQTIIPGTTACFDCLNRIDPQQTRIERLPEEDVNVEVDEGYVDGTALTPEPAVVTLNTTVAGMAVSELVGYITRIRPPRGFIHYEALSNEISLLDARGSRRQSCPTCGDEGILFHGEVMEPSDTELPDAVDDDLSSIPGPDQPTGDTTDVAEDAEAVQDGGTTTATSPDGHNPTTADTPSSAVEEGPESRPDALTKAMRALSNYVEEVLPWRH